MDLLARTYPLGDLNPPESGTHGAYCNTSVPERSPHAAVSLINSLTLCVDQDAYFKKRAGGDIGPAIHDLPHIG